MQILTSCCTTTLRTPATNALYRSKSRQSTRHALAVGSASSMGHLVCGCGNCQIDHDHCDRGRQTPETCDGDDETPYVRRSVRCRRDDAYTRCCARRLGAE